MVNVPFKLQRPFIRLCNVSSVHQVCNGIYEGPRSGGLDRSFLAGTIEHHRHRHSTESHTLDSRDLKSQNLDEDLRQPSLALLR